MPSIHVFTPAYNVSRSIAPFITDLNTTLSSLVKQNKISSFTITVVNDGSSDDTSDKLARLRSKYALNIISFNSVIFKINRYY